MDQLETPNVEMKKKSKVGPSSRPMFDDEVIDENMDNMILSVKKFYDGK
jgi:hypothetical protein